MDYKTMSNLAAFQLQVAQNTQPFFHNATPRYTTFRFRKLDNVINFGKDNPYWEGPINNGLLHVFYATLCITAMYVFGISNQVIRPPSTYIVCIFKALILSIGIICFLSCFITFYGHIGIFHVWGANMLQRKIGGMREDICNFQHGVNPSQPEKLRTLATKIGAVFQAADSKARAHENFSDYAQQWEDYAHSMKQAAEVANRGDNNSVQEFIDFLDPICKSNLSTWIGEWDAYAVTWNIATYYALIGALLSIYTAVLSYAIMGQFFRRSVTLTSVLIVISALTSIAWWACAAVLVVWLIGLSDLRYRYPEAIVSILQPAQPEITLDIVLQFLKCEEQKQKSAEKWPLLSRFRLFCGDLNHFSKFVFRSSEIYDNFPSFLQIQSNKAAIDEVITLVYYLFNPCMFLAHVDDFGCGYYTNLFEEVIGTPLCVHFYWAFYVSYVFSVLLAVLLTIFVVLALRVRRKMKIICCRKDRMPEEPDILKCLPECPRKMDEPDPLPPIRKRCPPPCKGLPQAKQAVNVLANMLMSLNKEEKKPEGPTVCVKPTDEPPPPKEICIPPAPPEKKKWRRKKEKVADPKKVEPGTTVPVQGSAKPAEPDNSISDKSPRNEEFELSKLERCHTGCLGPKSKGKKVPKIPVAKKEKPNSKAVPEITVVKKPIEEGVRGDFELSKLERCLTGCIGPKSKGKKVPKIPVADKEKPNTKAVPDIPVVEKPVQRDVKRPQANSTIAPVEIKSTLTLMSVAKKKKTPVIYQPFGKKLLARYKKKKSEAFKKVSSAIKVKKGKDPCNAPCSPNAKAPRTENEDPVTVTSQRGRRPAASSHEIRKSVQKMRRRI